MLEQPTHELTDGPGSSVAGQRVLLEVHGLSKAFPGVQALGGVDFSVRSGEVHALVGENGAGKSTLIKILSGAYLPDSGQIVVDGQTYAHLTPRLAQGLGIRTIYQETNLVPWLSVAENILLGRLPGRRGLVDWKMMRHDAAAVLDSLGMELDLDAEVASLSVAKQQSVEIAKALYRQAKVVIMDEPTSAFGHREVEHLFQTIRALRQKGLGIIYISHHLEEVFAIADRITVVRDGCVVGERSIAGASPSQLMNMMVGREISGVSVKVDVPKGDVVLRMRGVGRGDAVQAVSFELRRGEILGIAGMVGSGRTELLRMIFGVDRPDEGEIEFLGSAQRLRDPEEAIRRGIALVPEDRKTQGLVLCLDLQDNIMLASRLQRGQILPLAKEQDAVKRQMQAMDIRGSRAGMDVQYLSGGNQQKVVLGKWLEAGAELFLFDEPTRGVDVGAKLEIHRLIVELARQGKAIIMVSSDMPEVLALSDRILVMRRGKVAGEFTATEATEHGIIACALGGTDAK